MAGINKKFETTVSKGLPLRHNAASDMKKEIAIYIEL